MASFRLKLFRRFRLLREGGDEVALSSKKAQGLLAYLALNPDQRNTRERLAALLWSDRPEEQARHSLRQTVLTLHRALGDDGADEPTVAARGDELALNLAHVDVDALTFQRLAAEDSVEALERAMALYEGDLLDGVTTRSDGFDDWLAGERTRLTNLACDALARLAAHYAGARRSEAAVEAAERMLALDPLREDGHRMLMRLHEAAGHRAAALRQYQQCADAVRRELDAEPEPETTRLYENIRSGSEELGGESPVDAGAIAAPVPGAPAKNGETAEKAIPAPPAAAAQARRSWRTWAAAAGWRVRVAVIASTALIVAVLVWLAFPGLEPSFEPARQERMAFPLPKQPSIVVLPFKNLTGDPKDDTFGDGITEGITSALANVSEMFVIAHSTALTYKAKPLPIRQVAENWGVRYVLEGSVQRSGDRLRIYVRLIDAKEGHLLWNERYDREEKNVFKLQDDITFDVITQLQVKLTEGEQERISRIHGTKNLEAWVKAALALKHMRRATLSDNLKAREIYQEAIKLDPKYPGAWDGLAMTYWIEAYFGWTNSPEASLKQAHGLARKALELDDERPRTYAVLGSISLLSRQFDQAVTLGNKAVTLNPSGADVAALLALTLTYTGEPDRALRLVNRARRLSPYYAPWYMYILSRAHRLTGRYEKAIAACRSHIERDPQSVLPHLELAVIYAAQGDQQKARAQAAEVLRLNPNFTVTAWARALPYKDPSDTNRDLDLLRRAGLPK